MISDVSPLALETAVEVQSQSVLGTKGNFLQDTGKDWIGGLWQEGQSQSSGGHMVWGLECVTCGSWLKFVVPALLLPVRVL